MNEEYTLITGGAGYIGCKVVEDRIKKGENIIILDNFSRGKYHVLGPMLKEGDKKKIIEKIDLRDRELVGVLFKKYKITKIIHLAAIVDAFTTNREGKDVECKAVNQDATIQLAKKAKENGVKKFIYQSTVSLYSQGENLTEDAEKNPLSVYGLTKKIAEEEILGMADENFKAVSIRPATEVGWSPAFGEQTIVNLSCVRGVYNIPLDIFESALDGLKSYLYIGDNIEAINFLEENIDKFNGKAFNAVSFHASLRQVIDMIEKYLGRKIPINIIKENKINQQVYTISGELLKQSGFNSKGTLKLAIEETLDNLTNKK